MGFLDDLDSAFDTLLNDSSKEETPPKVEPEPAVMDPLKGAMADEQSAVLQALITQLESVPRRVFLTALAASLDRFKALEASTDRGLAIQKVAHMLRTRQGRVRQRLTASQRGHITALQSHLVAASPLEVHQVRRLLLGLAAVPDFSSEQIFQLYAAGIWRADQVKGEHLNQLADVTGWAPSALQQLHKTLSKP